MFVMPISPYLLFISSKSSSEGIMGFLTKRYNWNRMMRSISIVNLRIGILKGKSDLKINNKKSS